MISIGRSYRAAKVAVVVMGGAGVLAGGVRGEEPALEKHCPEIRIVFSYGKFKGSYKKEVDAWLKGGCKGWAPMPKDPHNNGWFNTVAGILQNGGGISITP